MGWILGLVIIIACIYMIRYYRLKANLRNSAKELQRIAHNQEENRILLISYPDKEAESFLEAMNEYILLMRKNQIFYQGREKELRAQIENISHDLRTPLTAIIGYLDLLELDNMSKEDKEILVAVQKKAKFLQGLINNFYDLSRLEMNDYQLHSDEMDLTRFARETILLFYQEFEKNGITVEFSVKHRQDALLILADSGAMGRIFNNMMQNALRYAKSSLHITVFEEEGKGCISFENDTDGLDPEDIPHLFERFFMQEKSRTSQSTGLGLTISKLLAEAMGGSAEANLVEDRLRITYRFEEV